MDCELGDSAPDVSLSDASPLRSTELLDDFVDSSTVINDAPEITLSDISLSLSDREIPDLQANVTLSDANSEAFNEINQQDVSLTDVSGECFVIGEGTSDFQDFGWQDDSRAYNTRYNSTDTSNQVSIIGIFLCLCALYC